MSRRGVAMLAGALALATSVAGAQEPVQTVVTRGEGVVRAAPEVAFVVLQVETRAATPTEAQRLNADVMTHVSAELTAANLGDDAIRTLGINLQPEFDYRDGGRELRGYMASNIVEVRLEELPRLGEVIDRAVAAGVTSVNGVRFDVRDRRALERRAIGEAVADAKARAEAAAAGAGASIDAIVEIVEQGAQPVPQGIRMAMQAEVVQAATPVVPGQIEIRAGVTLTARLR